MHKTKVVISRESVHQRVEELGREISACYGGEPVLAVCVLKGAFIFFADLVRAMTIEPEVDFIRIASYGAGQASSGEIRLTKDLEMDVAGKHLLIVEDIVDTGHSMLYLRKAMEARNPKSIKICALIDKRERREVDVAVDFPGFVVDQGFLVGYGLDLAEKYRHLDGVYTIVE